MAPSHWAWISIGRATGNADYQIKKMDWELSKENVQPLRSGRDVKLLNAALKTKLEAEASAKVKVEKLETERR